MLVPLEPLQAGSFPRERDDSEAVQNESESSLHPAPETTGDPAQDEDRSITRLGL